MLMNDNYYEQMDETLNDVMVDLSKQHKAAIFKKKDMEHQKQQALERKIAEEKEAKEARKRKREMLREINRLDLLKNAILKEILKEAQHEEFATKMQVYDVRDQ